MALSFRCLSQDIEKVDSLLQLLEQRHDQETRVRLYGKICWEYACTRESTGIAKVYADSIFKIGQHSQDQKTEVMAHFYYGVIDRHEGNLQHALEHLDIYLRYQRKTNNEEGEASALFQIGAIHEALGNYDESLMAYYRTLELHRKHDFQYGVGFVTNGLGNIYRKMDKYPEAIGCYARAIGLFDSLGYEGDKAYTLENLGSSYLELKDYEKAIIFLEEALEIDTKLGVQYGVASELGKIGIVYNKTGKHDKALEYHLKALAMREQLPAKDELASGIVHVGYTYLELCNYRLAEEYLLKGLELAEAIDAKPIVKSAYESLIALYEGTENFRLAYKYSRLFNTVKDSLLNEEKAKQMNELKVKYETEQKESQIRVQKAKLEQKETMQNLILTGALSVVLMISLAFQFYRQKQRIKLMEAARIQELNKMKTNFFANISHEFRTPLTLIMGLLSKMMRNDKYDTDVVEQNFRVMQNNSKRLLRLINQLLEFSRLDEGQSKIRAVQVDLIAFLRDIALSFYSSADQKGIELLFNGFPIQTPHSDSGIIVWLDEEKMETVFYNLLSNALKFADKGGKIEIATSLGKTTGYIEVAISNTGRGIPADILPNVFDRFFQVKDDAASYRGGTGIGLALAKELVELHRGSINATSEENDKTTFTVCLRLDKEHFRPEEINRDYSYIKKPEEPESDYVPVKTFNAIEKRELDDILVLIVEDNHELLHYIAETLIDRYQVVEADNGKHALDEAQRLLPDLIISDVMMPEMDGIELLRAIKTNDKTNHIPVILLTAKATSENRIEGLEYGADDYIVKPFDPEELRYRVKNLIESRMQLRDKYSREVLLKPKNVVLPSTHSVFLEKLMKILEERTPDEDFSVEELGKLLGMSRAQTHRKIKALTDQSPSEFIRNFRLQRAAELIKKDVGTLSEIAYMVGFNSQAYFTKCFQSYFHCSPSEFKKAAGTPEEETP